MIYITGDVHCPIDIKKLNSKNFPEKKTLTKNDYLIICGDMGIVWDGSSQDTYWQKWFSSLPCTTLFIDGNHENFDLLNKYQIQHFAGGRVHRIEQSVYHLMRGEIYTLDNKTFFCFGGAQSHDKHLRKEGISWWPQEMPSLKEMEYGINNLNKHGGSVDYIITHDFPIYEYQNDSLISYLNFINNNYNFQHWYFGHHHKDCQVDNKHTCVYQSIHKINKEEEIL